MYDLYLFVIKLEGFHKTNLSVQYNGTNTSQKIASSCVIITIMTLSFRTDRSGQTMQTHIRLLPEKQSDQGLHCLLFHLHHFDQNP